jgi:hypothetical protein
MGTIAVVGWLLDHWCELRLAASLGHAEVVVMLLASDGRDISHGQERIGNDWRPA